MGMRFNLLVPLWGWRWLRYHNGTDHKLGRVANKTGRDALRNMACMSFC